MMRSKDPRGTACRIVLILLLALGAAVSSVALAHSPVMDACTCDWCYFTTPGPDDTGTFLNCDLRENISPDPPPACTCSAPTGVPGAELVWYDDEADNLVVNDIANIATTFDATNVYFAAALFNDPDPLTPPAGQIAIDVAPGGNTEWRDTNGRLVNPGLGANSVPALEPDYLIVFDFSEFIFNGGVTVCPGSPGCTDAYGKVYEATTAPGIWTFLANAIVAVDPGLLGGSGGPPGKIETAIPWSAFASCAACPSFVPGDDYRLTFMVAEGAVILPPTFEPGGPIEDLITEAVAGTATTTPTSCVIGAGTTNCELVDGSADAFIAGGLASGEVPDGSNAADVPLRLQRLANGNVTLTWDASCLATDNDFEIYEGALGAFGSHTPVTCTTGGLTTSTFAPAAANNFYLVVPTNGVNEGSHGSDSNGNQRLGSTLACLARVREACP